MDLGATADGLLGWGLIVVTAIVAVLALLASVSMGTLAFSSGRDHGTRLPGFLTVWLAASALVTAAGCVQLAIPLLDCPANACADLDREIDLAALSLIPAILGLMIAIVRDRYDRAPRDPSEPWDGS